MQSLVSRLKSTGRDMNFMWVQSPKGRWPPIKAGDDTGAAHLHLCEQWTDANTCALHCSATSQSLAQTAALASTACSSVHCTLCAAQMAEKHFQKLKARWTSGRLDVFEGVKELKINSPAQVSVTA